MTDKKENGEPEYYGIIIFNYGNKLVMPYEDALKIMELVKGAKKYDKTYSDSEATITNLDENATLTYISNADYHAALALAAIAPNK